MVYAEPHDYFSLAVGVARIHKGIDTRVGAEAADRVELFSNARVVLTVLALPQFVIKTVGTAGKPFDGPAAVLRAVLIVFYVAERKEVTERPAYYVILTFKVSVASDALLADAGGNVARKARLLCNYQLHFLPF